MPDMRRREEHRLKPVPPQAKGSRPKKAAATRGKKEQDGEVNSPLHEREEKHRQKGAAVLRPYKGGKGGKGEDGEVNSPLHAQRTGKRREWNWSEEGRWAAK
jgi:hypothetical protein